VEGPFDLVVAGDEGLLGALALLQHHHHTLASIKGSNIRSS
jgi:hypothetical protein